MEAALIEGGLVMAIPLEHRERIRRILGELDCPQKIPCCCRDFESLSRIDRVGDTGLIECLDGRGPICPFGVPFGYAIFCRCPMRKYLSDCLGR